MGNCYLKRLMLKGGLRMAQDKQTKKLIKDALLKNMPQVEKDIAEHFLNNSEHIRKTMETILERSLDSLENDNLRQFAMEMSLQQVATKYQSQIQNEGEIK
jgi:uncharacterized protein YajQ (UPF0234 family)